MSRIIEGSNEMIVLTRSEPWSRFSSTKASLTRGLAAKTYIERFKQMSKVDALECVLEQILR